MEDAAPGVPQVPKALTRPIGAFLELLNPPEEDVPMEELLAKDEEELPMSDTKSQKRREPPRRGEASSPRPSKSLRASTSSARTRWRATSRVSMRPRPLGSADCRPRMSSGS